MSRPKPAPPQQPAALAAADYGIYGVALFVWGTSWYAIKLQIGVVAPEVSLVWRFGAAALIMLAWVTVARAPVRFPAEIHVRFAVMGVTMFSTNFAMFYIAGSFVTSGLLAVIFSLTSIVNVLFSALWLRERLELRVAVGALLGIAGIGCLFYPEIRGTEFDVRALFALMLGLFGVLSFCTGNMVARTIQHSGISLRSQNMWGMVYGTLWMLVLALLSGERFIIDPSPAYLGSLAWLALLSTVVAFAAYLTLLRRIGPGRAGYVTVMFPVVALAVSTLLEDYRWTLVGGLGVALALAGNYLVLSRTGSRPPAEAAATAPIAAGGFGGNRPGDR